MGQESYADSPTIEQVCNDPLLTATNAGQNRPVYYLRGPRSDLDTAVKATEIFYILKNSRHWT
jgi:ABC-type enterochelin transport system substrate-binding protein